MRRDVHDVRADADDDQPVQPRDPGLLRRGGQAGPLRRPAPRGRPGRSARTAVFRGGLRIYTTLDPRAQALATSSRNDVLAELSPEGTPAGTTPNGLHRGPGPLTGDPDHATGAVVSVRAAAPAPCGPWSAAPGSDGCQYNIATQGVGRLGRVDVQDLRAPGPARERLRPERQRQRRRTVHVPRHPRDVPRPVRGGELRNSGGGGGTITSQTLRSSNCAFVRLGQIVGIDKVVAAGAPDGDHHAARGRRVDAARHQGGATRSTWRRPWRRSPTTACSTRRTTSTGSRDPTARCSSPTSRIRAGPQSVQTARLAAEVLEKNVRERHRHPGPDPRAARGGQDGHGAGRQRRLVRRLHAVPGHRRLDGLARTASSRSASAAPASPAARTRPRSGAGTCGRGTRACEERAFAEPEPITRSSRYLRLDREFDSGGGGGSRDRRPRRRRHDDDHDPAGRWTRRPRPRSPRRRPRRRPTTIGPADDGAVTCQDGRA